MENQQNLTSQERLRATFFTILIISALIFMGMANVNAATDTRQVDDVFKINQQVNYSKPCFNNGTYCSASAVCNYTFFFPNSSVYVNNAPAVNGFTSHNYQLSFDEIGIYKVDMICLDGGLQGSETFYAQITGSGLNSNFTFLVIILVLSLGIMILGFAIKDGWVVTFGTLGLYFLGIWIMFNGIVDIRNPIITFPIAIIILGLAGYININSALEMIGED